MGDLVIQSRDEVRQFRPARDQRDAMRLEETATGFEGRIALRAQTAVCEPLAHGHIHPLELAKKGRPDEVVASVIPPTAGIAPAAREQSDPLVVSKRVDAEPAPRCEGTDSHRETPSVRLSTSWSALQVKRLFDGTARPLRSARKVVPRPLSWLHAAAFDRLASGGIGMTNPFAPERPVVLSGGDPRSYFLRPRRDDASTRDDGLSHPRRGRHRFRDATLVRERGPAPPPPSIRPP